MRSQHDSGKWRPHTIFTLPKLLEYMRPLIEPLLEDIGRLDLKDIHWVIVGGESGRRARPMQPMWADNIRRQCDSAGVAFFFKQWGTWGADGQRRSKKANGRSLSGKVWDEMPT